MPNSDTAKPAKKPEDVQSKEAEMSAQVNVNDEDDEANISHERKSQQPDVVSHGDDRDKGSATAIPDREERRKVRARRTTGTDEKAKVDKKPAKGPTAGTTPTNEETPLMKAARGIIGRSLMTPSTKQLAPQHGEGVIATLAKKLEFERTNSNLKSASGKVLGKTPPTPLPQKQSKKKKTDEFETFETTNTGWTPTEEQRLWFEKDRSLPTSSSPSDPTSSSSSGSTSSSSSDPTSSSSCGSTSSSSLNPDELEKKQLRHYFEIRDKVYVMERLLEAERKELQILVDEIDAKERLQLQGMATQVEETDKSDEADTVEISTEEESSPPTERKFQTAEEKPTAGKFHAVDTSSSSAKPPKKIGAQVRKENKVKADKLAAKEKKLLKSARRERREQRRETTRKSSKKDSKQRSNRKPRTRGERRRQRRKHSSSGDSSSSDSSSNGSEDNGDRGGNGSSNEDSSSGSSSSTTDSSGTDSNSSKKRHRGKRGKSSKTIPNWNRIEKLSKRIHPRLSEKGQFGAWEEKFKQLAFFCDWPESILDAQAPEYDPTTHETARDMAKRYECFLVLQEVVDNKHNPKFEAIVNGPVRANAQALYRRVVQVFSISGTFGSVIAQRNLIQKMTMSTTNLPVEAFGLAFVKQVKNVMECGGKIDEQLELIPMYLKALGGAFKSVVDDIEKSIEDEEGKYTDLYKVILKVDKHANKKGLTNVRSVSLSTATKLVKANAAVVGGKQKTPQKAPVKPKCFSCGGPHFRGDKNCPDYLSPEDFKKQNPAGKQPCKFKENCRNIANCKFDHSKDGKTPSKGGKKSSYKQTVKKAEVKVQQGLQKVNINGKIQLIHVESDNVINLSQTATGVDNKAKGDGIFLEGCGNTSSDASVSENCEPAYDPDTSDSVIEYPPEGHHNYYGVLAENNRSNDGSGWDNMVTATDADYWDPEWLLRDDMPIMETSPDNTDQEDVASDDLPVLRDSSNKDVASDEKDDPEDDMPVLTDDSSDEEGASTDQESVTTDDLDDSEDDMPVLADSSDEDSSGEGNSAKASVKLNVNTRADADVCRDTRAIASHSAYAGDGDSAKASVRLNVKTRADADVCRDTRAIASRRYKLVRQELLFEAKVKEYGGPLVWEKFAKIGGWIDADQNSVLYDEEYYDCLNCWAASILRVEYLQMIAKGVDPHPFYDMETFNRDHLCHTWNYEKYVDCSITAWPCVRCDKAQQEAGKDSDDEHLRAQILVAKVHFENEEKARIREDEYQEWCKVDDARRAQPWKGKSTEVYYRNHVQRASTKRRKSAWERRNLTEWEPALRRKQFEWAEQSVVHKSIWKHYYVREYRLLGLPGVEDDWMTSWEKQCSTRMLKDEKKANKRFSKMQRRARQVYAWKRAMSESFIVIERKRETRAFLDSMRTPNKKVGVLINHKVDQMLLTQKIQRKEKKIRELRKLIRQYPLILQNSTVMDDGVEDDSPIIDSGAMVHSVKNDIQLSNLSKVQGMTIAGIHGKAKPIRSKGTLKLKSVLPKTQLNVKDVYVVPHASVNLLSVGQFDDMGLTSTFKDGACSISDKNGVPLLHGVKEKGLYRVRDVEVNALSFTNHITNYDKSSLLRDHERLGHRAFSTVRKLLNYPPASRECLDPVCESCQYAQIRNKNIPKEALSRAPRFAYRLCSDTSNKKPATNAEGKTGLQRYVLTVDEATKTMYVDFNQRKSNAKFSVLTLIDSINTDRQIDKVHEHQTDGGKEWLNKKLNKELAQRGVTPRNSSPYCQYQNGVAESAMEYVERTSKAMLIRGSAPKTDWCYAVRHAVYLNDVLPNAVTMLSPYQSRNGMSPRDTAENIEGVLFCKCYAKMCNAGKFEDKAIPCIYLGRDPKSKGSLVRPIGGKITGLKVRVAQVVNYDVTSFPYSNQKVPRPHELAEVIYDSDSENEDDQLSKKKTSATKTPVTKKVQVVDLQHSDSDEEVKDNSSEKEPQEEIYHHDIENDVKEEIDEVSNVIEHPEGWIPGGKIGEEDAYDIEKIVSHRWNTRTRRKFREYQIKWEGDWPLDWVPESSIRAPELITDYWNSKKKHVTSNVQIMLLPAKVIEGGTEAVPKVEATLNPFKKLFNPASEVRPTDPKGFKKMLAHKHAEYFIEASNLEKVENKKWKAYIEVPRTSIPPGTKILKPVTVYTTKYNARGEIEKFKCRVCLDGSRTNVDPNETYEAMCSFSTIRLLFCLATRFRMHLVQTDIKNFYLQARLPAGKEYYAEIPDGWAEGNPKYFVAKVLAPWYGLREASKLSGDQFAAVMKNNGMIENEWMPKIFTQWIGDVFMMCAQWSDDSIWATTSISHLDKVLDKVHAKFELVRNYKPAKMLGAQIEYDRARGILKLHQEEYWNAKIKELEIPNKTARSPGVIPQKVPNPLFEDTKIQASEESIRTFQRHVGVHIWGLQTDASSAFVTNKLASGMVNPQKRHWEILARLEAYKNTYPAMGIVFRAADPPEILKKGHNLDCLTLFADADLAGDMTDSKSTSGYSCHLGESGMFDWKCKKQTCVCQSSCESETLSSKLATCTAIWLRNGLSAMGFTFTRPTPVCQDNQSAIALCESDRHHSRTRHFRMHVHFLKDCQAKRITSYPWVPTAHMRGDLFNKMHGPIVHERLLEMNQMSPHPIHTLKTKPAPMVIYGWVERRAVEKAEEKAASEKKANQPALMECGGQIDEQPVLSRPDIRTKGNLRAPYTERFKQTREYQKILRNSDRKGYNPAANLGKR